MDAEGQSLRRISARVGGTKVQEEVFGERREIGWEFPLDGLGFYVL